jgi:hypothetical protein
MSVFYGHLQVKIITLTLSSASDPDTSSKTMSTYKTKQNLNTQN